MKGSEVDERFRHTCLVFLGSVVVILSIGASGTILAGREVPAAYWALLGTTIGGFAGLIPSGRA